MMIAASVSAASRPRRDEKRVIARFLIEWCRWFGSVLLACVGDESDGVDFGAEAAVGEHLEAVQRLSQRRGAPLGRGVVALQCVLNELLEGAADLVGRG